MVNYKQPFSRGFDKVTLLLVNYPRVKLMNGQSIAMATTTHRLGGLKFVFTKRTLMRLGVLVYA